MNAADTVLTTTRAVKSCELPWIYQFKSLALVEEISSIPAGLHIDQANEVFLYSRDKVPNFQKKQL